MKSNKSKIKTKFKKGKKKPQSTFDSMDVIFQIIELIYDENGNVVDYYYLQTNPAFEKLVNKTKSELIGKRAKDILGIIEDHWLKTYEKVEKTGLPANYENYGEELDKYYNIYAWKEADKQVAIAFTDITKHKLSELKLITAIEQANQSKERFQLAMNASTDGLFDWNLETNEIYYSPGWKKMIGYEDDELPNDFSVFEEAISPSDLKKSWKLHQKLISKEVDRFVLEFKMKHKNGQWIDILSRAKAIFNDNGKAIRIVGTNTNITELNLAEARLRDSQNYLSAIFNNTQDLQLLSRYEGNNIFKVVAVNNSYLKKLQQLGLSASEKDIIGKSLKELLFTVLFLDQEVYDYTINFYQKAIKSGKQVTHTESFIINEKSYHSETSYTPIFNTEDGVTFVLYNSHDISKETESLQMLQSSEEKYRLAMDASTDGLWDWNIKTGTAYFNPAYSKIIGEVDIPHKYESWVDRIHPDDKEDVLLTLNDHLKGEAEFWQNEHRLHIKLDEWVWVLGRGRVVERNTEGKPTRMVGTMTDISERKLAEQEIIVAKERAEESDRLKSAFLANMSHEIRTPMNGILGFADLLKTPNLRNDKQKKYINIIENSGHRMLNIINDIIDISKIEAGLMEINIEESDLNEQIEYIYNFFKPEFDKKGLELNYHTTLPAKEAIIKTDSEKVFAILTNLVKNSIKYTNQGSIEFGYTKKDSMLEFYVKDTGIGIPKNRTKAIFDRFIQADIEDTMARQGVGLGLSITKSYIEMLGGTIWVESEEGVGSEFYFTLPYPG